MRDRANTHHDELIRRRKDYYRKKRNHDDETVFMKINFIEHRKEKNPRSEQKKRFKDEKKCYSCDKKSHFVRDCRSKNKKNRRQINVLIKVSDKTEAQKKESETDTLKVNTDDEYYRVENVDKLQKVLNGTTSGKAPASTQKVNDVIRRAFNRPKTSYPYKN